jgi:hypothetical protein
MSESVEKLAFKIGLSGTYHDRQPSYSVLINNNVVAEGTITVPSDEIFYVEFSADLLEEADHVLAVRLNNKQDTDVVESADKTVIVKDMLLNIDSVEIDDINIGSLKWTHSRYQLDVPHQFNGTTVSELTNCVNLGWNGAWEFAFRSPFYIWLLENL